LAIEEKFKFISNLATCHTENLALLQALFNLSYREREAWS